jgi:hypothetical protein
VRVFLPWLAILALAALASACGRGERADTEYYTNTVFGYRLGYPHGWIHRDDPHEGWPAFYPPGYEDVQVSGNGIPVGEGDTGWLAVWVHPTELPPKSYLPNHCSVTSSAILSIAGRQAEQYRLLCAPPAAALSSYEWRLIHTFLATDDWTLDFWARLPVSGPPGDEVQAAYNDMLESISLLNH